MPLDIQVTAPDGQDVSYNEQEILQQVAGMGGQVQGISPDGMTLIGMSDDGQQVSVPIQQLLQDQGFKVNTIRPSNADTSRVRPEWRVAVESLGDPDAQKSFLESKLRREGVAQPQVYGSGADWFTFDPGTAQWYALTNKDGMDLSDIASIAPAAVKGIAGTAGSIIGAGAGAVGGLGAGSIPGMMAGGAIGSGLAEAGMQGLMSLDPEYREQMTPQMLARSVGIEAVAGGAGSGIIGGAAKYGTPLIKNLATSGPVSTITKGIGKAADVAGNVVGGIGKFFSGGPIRSDIAGSMVMPGGTEAQLASMAMQAPAYIAKNAPGLVARGAETEIGRSILGEEAAANLASAARNITRQRTATSPIEAFNLQLRGKTADMPARDVMMNLAEEASKIGQASRMPRVPEIGFDEIGHGGFARPAADFAASEEARRQAFVKAGESIGKGIENMAAAGRGLEQGVRAAGYGAGKVAQGAGAGLEYGGKGLYNLGLIGQPLENMLAAQRGIALAEEAITPYPKSPLRRRKIGEKIMANN